MPGSRSVMNEEMSCQICSRQPPLLQCLLLLLFLGVSVCAAAADIEVRVDRSPVRVNESFRIIFSAQQSPHGNPDFSPLDKDFEVLSQSQSSSFTMNNGAFSKSMQWTLTVMARRSGVLTIPDIAFGADRSRPSTVTVLQQAAASDAAANGQDLFLQIEATPDQPYVQAQVIYTVRFFRRVDISQASLSEPQLQDAVIEKIGEDRTYNTQSGGGNYVVTERKYAIFPQKSGPLRIPPVTLTAEVVVDGRPRFNGFFHRRMTRSKRVVSQAIDLNVQAVPAEFHGRHWLPAEQLLLKQEWSGDIRQVKAGEPLTRTLVLLARGSTVGQLPELYQKGAIHSPSGGELQSYPDQPLLKERKKPQGIVALREEKIALIPSRAGTYRLPEIAIPWWNTRSNKMLVAKIPAVTLEVSAAPQTAQEGSIGASEDMLQEFAASRSKAAAVQSLPAQDRTWLWVSVFLAIGWLATLLYLLWRGQKDRRMPPVDAAPTLQNDSTYRKLLQRACRDDNAVAAKDALLLWGRTKFRETSLKGIARHCDAPLQQEIELLNAVVYGHRPCDWQGKSLWQMFQECSKDDKQELASDPPALEPLYKL